MLKAIEGQTMKMSDMVTQLLWLAKLRDATEVALPIELRPIAEAALSRFVDRIQSQGVKVSLDDEMPMVMGQGIWVEEVIANLVSNALKYMGEDNSAPRIKLSAHQRGDYVIFELEDNGMGIAPEDQNRLFEMFGRIRNKRTRDIQGLGLGLSIVQRIVGKLGGEVGVRSMPGVGSTFWFSLPSPRKRSLERDEADYTFDFNYEKKINKSR
jgi:signal transduction histidine kinase